jgi:primosomal protein N' (replication factor Y)
MLAKVAIDLALDRLFTYEVPEALQKKLAVGQLLSVPFGHRQARGFVLQIVDADEDVDRAGRPGYTLKPVAGIVDETPFFTPPLLDLVRRLSAYTASPLESVLKAALPASVLKKNARARELLFVGPNVEAALDGLTARQRWLCEQIRRLDGGWMTSLCRELSTTPASLKALAAKGLVTVEVRAKRRDPLSGRRILPSKPLPLNPAQAAALEAIRAMKSSAGARTLLLHGVTGSGKTEVYLQAIADELAAGRGAIVMVPEIALTPQTVQRFASRFGARVAVLHSALSDGERYDEWHRIRSGEARVVIGPRSAVFAPVHRLGLIVVDEEHETSYKQDETPRYHARDAAVLRGVLEGAVVVLGSATPSLESWMNVRRGKYAYAEMAARAGSGTLPRVQVVNMEEEPGRPLFSRPLLDALALRLDRAEQSILFLNRRGYSRSVSCTACGHVMTCAACDVAYTYHRADDCLRCHICGGWTATPKACPACGSPAFSYKGVGTQRVEAALARCFPRARILRMDADSTSRRRSHDDLLSVFRRGEADILLGTQMIAKGLDFPNVTLVGVLNADSSLNMPDFRAAERTYQLLAQVAGRAGRAELPGEVYVQSFDPSAPAIQAAARGNYAAFAAQELRDREAGFFPPYCHLAVIVFSSCDMTLASGWAQLYAQSLLAFAERLPGGGLVVSEAVPSALEKADGRYRWQIVLRAPAAATLVRAWRWISAARPAPKDVRIVLDVDAYTLT